MILVLNLNSLRNKYFTLITPGDIQPLPLVKYFFH